MNPKFKLKMITLGVLLGTFAWGRGSIDEWIGAQKKDCEQLLSKNINPDGTRPGTVIASPSRHFPDYFYHWVRDAGLVMSTWLDVRNSGSVSDAVKARIDQDMRHYWQITLHHQTRQTLGDLGEVKFYVNGEAYREPWGRPQNDGPAIRALSLMKWRNFLASIKSPLAYDPALYSADLSVHSAIKRDLEYISHRWRDTDFDVWEEVKGHHFFTRLFQMHALRVGSNLAAYMNDPHAAAWYAQNAESLRIALDKHWDPKRGFVSATLNRDGGLDYKSGLDSAVVIAVLETAQYSDLKSDAWTVLDPRIQSTIHRLEAEFTKIYSINSLVGAQKGPMIGRYPEDTYDGVQTGKLGNPWFLNTHYVAEFYYKLADALNTVGELKITPESRAFWNKYVDSNQAVLIKGLGNPSWDNMITGLIQQGDAIMNHSRIYVDPFGGMAEQVHRDTGTQAGARDLSWSYSSFIRAATAREKVTR
jgi:glucoamylase